MDNYKKLAQWLALLVMLTLAAFQTSDAQGNDVKAFPGAEGYGTDTTHGRGGEVIAVTNLNDSGPGSLRDAVSQSGPRIVVFRVSGTIRLREHIRVKRPYIYIAGQTAPGDGIALQGAGFVVETHDVLIRFMRVRPGDARRGPAPQTRDGIAVAESGIYNVVIDRNSFSWGIDENTSVWFPVRDVTYSWNIISEGLMYSTHPEGKHSMGMLIGNDAQNISIHHNLFAHNNERNPLITANTRTDIVNNVIYNWGKQGLTSSDARDNGKPIRTNIVNNYFKPGPDSEPWEFFINRGRTAPVARSEFYLSGNIGPNRPNNNMDEWAISRFEPGDYRRNRPHNVEPVTTWSAEEAYERVLAGAGAIYPRRDAVDRRVINEVRDGRGRIIDRVSQTPGYPTLRSANPPRDSDNDGMPDSWERERGLNPNNPNDNTADRNNDGYTNIEEYINGLSGDTDESANIVPTATPGREVIEQPEEDPTDDIAVVSFTLVNADNNRDIRQLNNNDVLILSNLPERMSIRANTQGDVGSVLFQYNNAYPFHMENHAPYSIAGDSSGNYAPAEFPRGEHTLTATPHERAGGRGDIGQGLTIHLIVADRGIVPQPTLRPRQARDTGNMRVVNLTLVNADTGRDIRPLNSDDTLNLADLPPRMSIRANTQGDVGSVTFAYDNGNPFQVENVAPYTLAGDSNGRYTPAVFPLGEYTLTANPHKRAGGRGDVGESLTVDLNVVDEVPQPTQQVERASDMRVVNFTLVNADTDRDIRNLNTRDTLVLSDLPPRLSIRANTQGDVGSVLFKYNNGDPFHIENIAPYAIAGDRSGDYAPADLPLGEYTLTAVPHHRRSGRGSAGEQLTIFLNVIDRQVVAVQPTATPTPVVPTQQPIGGDDIQVLSFTLVDAQTNQDIRPLRNGDALVLAELPSQLSIRANTAGNVGSVVFSYLNEPNISTENVAPYTINGDTNGNYTPMNVRMGQNILSAAPYTGSDGAGAAGQSLTVGFTVVQDRRVAVQPTQQPTQIVIQPTPIPVQPSPTPGQLVIEDVGSGGNTGGSGDSGGGSTGGGEDSGGGNGDAGGGNNTPLRVTSFTVVNANTGEDLGTLQNGMTIPASQIPGDVNIRANVSGPVESVRFTFTGRPRNRTENEFPYMLAGNVEDNIFSIEGTSTGTHTVTARAYAEDEGNGRSSEELRITFTVD